MRESILIKILKIKNFRSTQKGMLYYISKIIKKLHFKAVKNSIIHKNSKIEAGSEIVNSIMDKHSYCGYFCEIFNAEIGSYCSIGNNVVIGGAMHPIDWVSTSPVFYFGRDSIKAKFSLHKRENAKKTIIGNDVWIGERAMIKQGVIIGTGSVIGMGSVVTKNVKPYSIVAGCPAKEIRMRFDDKIIRELLKIRWWDWPEEKIVKYAKFIKTPHEFITHNKK